MTPQLSAANPPTTVKAHGLVLWVAGTPSSRKNSLVRMTRTELLRRGYPCAMLDGDAIRAAIAPLHAHLREVDEAFFATLIHLAVMLRDQSFIVLVSAVPCACTEQLLKLAGPLVWVNLEESREDGAPDVTLPPSTHRLDVAEGGEVRGIHQVIEMVSRLAM